jgi:hypothetical protein
MLCKTHNQRRDRSLINHILTAFFTLELIIMLTQEVQSAPVGSSRLDRSNQCHQEELHQVAHAYARSVHMRFLPRGLNCEGDWAVLVGDLENPNAPSDGPQGVVTSLIFHLEGRVWKNQDSFSVCGTLNTENPEAKPNDATIPASLYFIGCLVG